MQIGSIVGPKKQIGVVKEKKLLAEKIYEIDVELPVTMIFRPGHYVSIKVNDSGVRRSYSVVEYRDKKVKLLVDTGPGGLGSLFFERLKIEDNLEVMGFFGNFFVERNDIENNKRIFFVATGTGIAPFLPMIKDLLNNNYPERVFLWWGVRFVSRLYWQDDLREIKKKWANFEYRIYVSRPEIDWSGKTGRVGDDLDEVNIENSSWYLCGATEMIEQMKERLISRGVDEENINYEKFF